jgi:hypothetical protein
MVRTRKKRDRSSLLAEWKKLAAAAEVHKNLLPELGPFHAALEGIIEDIGSTASLKANLDALRKEAAQDLRNRYAAGDEIAARMKSYVMARFGRQDARLEEFGIKLGGRRRKPPEPERRKGSPGYHSGGCP